MKMTMKQGYLINYLYIVKVCCTVPFQFLYLIHARNYYYSKELLESTILPDYGAIPAAVTRGPENQLLMLLAGDCRKKWEWFVIPNFSLNLFITINLKMD